MSAKPDKRKDRFDADVVKLKDKPLTQAQKTALIFDLRAAHACAVRGGKERDFETWRHDVIAEETQDHRAGQITGLSQAKQSHFKAIRARAYEEAGRLREAFDLRMMDTPEAERHAMLLALCRRVLSVLPPLNDLDLPETVAAEREAYGDLICQRMFRCRMERADCGQLDKLYRELKNTVPAAVKTREALKKVPV